MVQPRKVNHNVRTVIGSEKVAAHFLQRAFGGKRPHGESNILDTKVGYGMMLHFMVGLRTSLCQDFSLNAVLNAKTVRALVDMSRTDISRKLKPRSSSTTVAQA